jgi:hypothetical protein
VLRVEALESRELLDGSQSPVQPNQQYVAQLYLDLLQRSADPGGLAYWTDQLNLGTARADVVREFQATSEYATEQLQILYNRLLGRKADVPGLIHFEQELNSGQTIQDVTAQILSSDEYYDDRAGNSNATFLAALYSDIFDRAPDTTGVTQLGGSLDLGESREAVVQALMSSDEAHQRQIDQLYHEFLFRAPDDTGLAFFKGALQEGASWDQIVASMISSDEYFAHVTGQAAPVPLPIQHYQQLVDKLYQEVLGRLPSARETPIWTQQFQAAAAGGQAITTVLLGFLNSNEALQTVAARWTQLYLGASDPLDQLKISPSVTPIVSALTAGSSFSSALSNLLASDTFYTRAGGTDVGFVTRLYQTVLSRTPTDQEVQIWTSDMPGQSRQKIAQSIVESPEADRVQVARWYRDYLDRGSDFTSLLASPELSLWTQRLQEYRDPQAILAEVLASEEYLGFPADLYDQAGPDWSPPPGPFAHPADVQRGAGTSFQSGQPLLATTYFYWYDAASGVNVRYADGSSFITHHPPTLDGFSYLNVDWHAQQLQDMMAAGIDVALPVWYGSPYSDPDFSVPTLWNQVDPNHLAFSDRGLRRLGVARTRLTDQGLTPPKIGMFYDTTSLDKVNVVGYHVDLRTYGGKRWFYESIRNFFSHVPASAWARIDGKPLIFVYHLGHAVGVDETLMSTVRIWFQQDFGSDCYLVMTDETRAPNLAFSPSTQPWVDDLHQKPAQAALADLLASDAFYTASGGSDSGFIDRLYDKLLNRAPDNQGKQTWLNALQTMSRHDLASIFVQSAEAERMLVAGWYRHYLRRLDPVGTIAASHEIDLWVGLLMAGTDAQSVLAGILASAEFYRASGGSDAALVANLYEQVFLRNPDPAGQALWLARLGSVPRQQMIVEFLHTDEAYQILSAGWVNYDLGVYWPGHVDAYFSWGGALAPEYRDVAAIGPGYDQSAARDRSTLIVDRQGGDDYRQAWEQLLAMDPHPWLVHVETWNELIEGSDIAESKEFGRLYIDLTRQYADRFHQVGVSTPG